MINKTFEELRLSGRLPSPSGVGMEILKLTQNDDSSAEELGITIMKDSVLTGRILKLANSARSASIEPVTTVTEAAMRLGLRTVCNVALGMSLLSENRNGGCEAFDYDVYWSRSLARAVAGQALSRLTGKGVPEESYILGLLSEVGKLALASVYPEEYSSVIASTKDRGPKVLSQTEQEQFAIDHLEVSQLMLQEWGLPETFQAAVRKFEFDPDEAEREALEGIAQVLRYSHLIAEICVATNENTPVSEWKRVAEGLEQVRAEVGLEAETFFNFCDGIAAEWLEWGATMKVPTQESVDFRDLANKASQSSAESQASQPEAAPTSSSAPRVEDDAKLRILAVDDDPSTLKVLERMLINKGYRVITANDGSEALEKALKFNPHIVLADWMMPKLDGIQLCQSLRKIDSGRRMYFLLLTGRDEEDRVVEAFDAGVDDFIVKPIKPKLLIARIKGGERVVGLQAQVEADRETMQRQVAELGRLTRKLRSAAMTDVLTELPNRRYALKRLEREWAQTMRSDRPLSLVIVDIDNFKSVNDTYGHDIGDAVLKETAAAMRRQTRESEDVCRIGGEEFCIICENATLEGAQICAERLRSSVEANHIKAGDYDGHVTLSLGVAQVNDDMLDINDLLKAADEQVYAAKDGGRNQVRPLAKEARRRKSA